MIAAFADMVAGTFNAFDASGVMVEAARSNGAAGSISLLSSCLPCCLAWCRKVPLHRLERGRPGPCLHGGGPGPGHDGPPDRRADAWIYITFVYIFFAAVLPMWLLKQPRDYMTTFMFIGMIAGAVVACWWPTPP